MFMINGSLVTKRNYLRLNLHIGKLKKKRVPNTEYEMELFKIMDFPNIKCPISKKRKSALARKAKSGFQNRISF